MKIKRWKVILSVCLVALSLIFGALFVVVLPVLIPTVAQATTSDPSICTAPAGKLPKSVPEPLNSISTSVGEEKGIPGYAVALIYFSENGWHYREPPPPYGKGNPYPQSHKGATGPFQFLRGTYRAFRNANPNHKPGNIMDLTDAAYAAGEYLKRYGKLKVNSPIGDPANPKKGTVLWAFGAYNAGPAGNFSNPETSKYLREAATEYYRLFSKSATSTSTSPSTQSKLINLCSALTELGKLIPTSGSDPGSDPTFGAAPTGSCPQGKLKSPVIRTVGIGNPRQGRKVLLCRVGGITVNAKVAAQWQWLIAKAKSQGIKLSGGGFRSYERQVALRRAHCGSSHYAIYQMRARFCTPDTAVPGTSFHETGHAVDLNMTRGVFRFMWANGPTVGIYKTVPSENWHWSTKVRI